MVFGRSAKMAGILCQPTEPGNGLPGVVFLNSGILHRVGANRLYVKIARALAERGFSSLRFDFSGVGDSEARKDALRFEQSSVIEAREAMDQLGTVAGVDRFILAGLCSGADVGFWTALEDDRVAALAQMDAFAYRTWRFQFNRIAPKVFDLRQWAHSLKVRLRPEEARPEDPDSYVDPEYSRQFPPRQEVAGGLKTLVSRGVDLFYFFSGDDAVPYNYRDQYRDCFRDVSFGPCLQVEFEPEADHIVSNLDHQRFVVSQMVDWATRVSQVPQAA
jgi:pimeloyl-ACP methyl ester carboxylesterase